MENGNKAMICFITRKLELPPINGNNPRTPSVYNKGTTNIENNLVQLLGVIMDLNIELGVVRFLYGNKWHNRF